MPVYRLAVRGAAIVKPPIVGFRVREGDGSLARPPVYRSLKLRPIDSPRHVYHSPSLSLHVFPKQVCRNEKGDDTVARRGKAQCRRA